MNNLKERAEIALFNNDLELHDRLYKQGKNMKFAKRFNQRLTIEQRKHLETVRDRTGVDINTQIMQLVQKDMEAKQAP